MTLFRKTLVILAFTTLVLELWCIAHPPTIVSSSPDPSGTLVQKMAFYRLNKDRYNLVFTGDSRTLTNIDPSRIDAAVGSKSFNLGTWQHWFPTQLQAVEDLVNDLPPDTTVVWSLGFQNFTPMYVAAVYPISLSKIPTYERLGFRWEQLENNLLGFNVRNGWLGVVPGLKFYANREQLKAKFESFSTLPFPSLEVPSEADAARSSNAISVSTALQVIADKQALRTFLDVHPSIERDPSSGVFVNEIRATSVETYTSNGNYFRFELDPSFYRRRQAEMATEVKDMGSHWTAFEPEERYWLLFEEILNTFASAKVRLIVNEFEEAPYYYRFPGNRAYHDEFMGRVRSFVESKGFPYVRADLAKLDDADYFDHNHLNSRGVDRFTPLLIEALEPYLSRGPSAVQ